MTFRNGSLIHTLLIILNRVFHFKVVRFKGDITWINILSYHKIKYIVIYLLETFIKSHCLLASLGVASWWQ